MKLLCVLLGFAISLAQSKTLLPLLNKNVDKEEMTVEKPMETEEQKLIAGSLKLIQTPRRFFEGSSVRVEVICNLTSAYVGVYIDVTSLYEFDGIEEKNEVTVYKKIYTCSKSNAFKTLVFPLKLPRYLAYKPAYYNRYSFYIEDATIKTWMINKSQYSRLKNSVELLKENKQYYSEPLKLMKPLDRPEKPLDVCFQWYARAIHEIKTTKYRPVCENEKEVINAVYFPVALSGFKTGVHRTHLPFKNPFLRKRHNHRISHPEFSFVLWLYIQDYCPSGYLRCNILQHITWDDNYASPRLYIGQRGIMTLELVMEDGASVIGETDFPLDTFQWNRVTIACKPTYCVLTTNYGEDYQSGWSKTIRILTDSPFYFDDTLGLVVYGGSELGPSFRGFIGKAVYYRSSFVTVSQIPKVEASHPMMMVGLWREASKCGALYRHLDHFKELHEFKQQKRLQKITCRAAKNPFKLIQEKTPFNHFYNLHHYHVVHKYLKSNSHLKLNEEKMAVYLFEKAELLLTTKGIKGMNISILLLQQSSCLGNHDSSFMLSSFLNHGLAVPMQETLSHSYLMKGALLGNRLCLLALGNNYVYGLDGFPVDYEQAYVYFKAVADMTNRDFEVHDQNDVYTEMVRLTNHYDVAEQTEENGDVVTYLKMQASQDDFYSIQTLARMYYWGSGGLERDVGRAVHYYRLAAQHNIPSALYDYGIILLKGHGVEKDVEKAVEVLKKAADLGYPQALNTLGWYYMDVVENFTEAAMYFHRSHELGNKDASYNLAYMLLNGIYPNSPVDKVKAWDYLAAGALRGQHDASIFIGMYNMRGHPRIVRNLSLSIGWTRHVAEQNPGVGKLLFKGLKAYKKQNWFLTLIYYYMAASTGVEVANFNLAYLCEEDYGGYIERIEKECVWRHYNLSTQRAPNDVDPYAWNKMAYYYYYHGIDGRKDKETAIELYAHAALSGDSQALYNLALLSNDGVKVNEYILNRLGVPLSIQNNKVLLSFHLLQRCQESHNQESYIPCTFAMYKVAFEHYCSLIGAHYKRAFGVVVLVVISIISLNIVHQRQIRPYNINF